MKKYLLSLTAIITFMFTGCTYSNWNVGNQYPAKKPTDTSVSTNSNIPSDSEPDMNAKTPKDRTNMFHINTVINTWGQPNDIRVNPDGKKVYIWQNCKSTGKYIDRCTQDSCETVPETTCCERALVTDEEGYVTNLKEAIASCM